MASMSFAEFKAKAIASGKKVTVTTGSKFSDKKTTTTYSGGKVVSTKTTGGSSSKSSSSSSSKTVKQYVDANGVIRKEGTSYFKQSDYDNAVNSGQVGLSGLPKVVTPTKNTSLRSSNSTPVNNAVSSVVNEIKQEKEQPSFIQSLLPKISSAYQSYDDTFFQGYLPGGNTPTSVKDTKLRQNIEEKESLNEAKLNAQIQDYDYKLQKEANETDFKRQLEALQQQQDIVSQSWLENIGLFRSEQEKAFQEAVKRQQAYDLLTSQIPNTAISYDAYSKALAENPSFNDAVSAVSVPLSADKNIFQKIGAGLKTTSNYALALGGVAIVSLLLLRGKK